MKQRLFRGRIKAADNMLFTGPRANVGSKTSVGQFHEAFVRFPFARILPALLPNLTNPSPKMPADLFQILRLDLFFTTLPRRCPRKCPVGAPFCTKQSALLQRNK
jgi:hypothetical protein